MPIDFFEKEVKKARERFNQTFGRMTVCDIKLRQSTILAICFLGNLSSKIREAEAKDMVREDIKKFMRARNALNNTFTAVEDYRKERRVHGNSVNQTRGFPNRRIAR